MELNWVRSQGRKDAPGKPIQYGTTEEFYMYCLKTFDRSGRSIERRGRPPKQR